MMQTFIKGDLEAFSGGSGGIVMPCEIVNLMTPLYSIGTWDTDEQAYTPQAGLSFPSQNVPWRTLLNVVRELKSMGYSCHRYRDADGGYDDNDWCVLIERTDGAKMDGRR